jgi:hypothetical protein
MSLWTRPVSCGYTFIFEVQSERGFAMSRFDYLIDRVQSADIATEPFHHIYIEDFFSDEDFAEIVSAPEVNLTPATSDEDLFEKLFGAGYKIINFPGSITDREKYLRWRKDGKRARATKDARTEGFGVTLRLMEPRTGILSELRDFIGSEAFNRVIADRFGIDYRAVSADNGIQKYLDGYEISPHPDIRKKAATFMVNINSGENSEARNHHTHYMRFKDRYQYLQDFWASNDDMDRCWVPWDWCETVTQQTANNSIVIFSPSHDTMHAVKAQYDHLPGQRTQLYGNLWFKEPIAGLKKTTWQAMDLRRGVDEPSTGIAALAGAARSRLRGPIRKLRKVMRPQSKDVAARKKM